jgi:hypothetical protein
MLPGSAITTKVERDVLLSGLVVGMLPVHVVKGEVVLIRQLRYVPAAPKSRRI